ncbi:MAG: AfsR/SARP family transcriptional regulator, partial [Chloroflexota bacterium]
FDPRLDDPRLRFWSHYILARARIALGQTEKAHASYHSMKAALDRIRRESWCDSPVTASMLGRVAMVEWFLDDHASAMHTAECGLTLAEQSPATTRAERVTLHHILGTFMVWQGDYAAADQHLSAALALADTPADVAQRATIWNAQAGVARCRGEFIRTLGFLEQSLREPFVPPREQMLLTLQAAHALADVQDFRGAAKRYRQIAGMVRGPDRDGCLSRALAGLAMCCCFLGLLAEAEATLTRLERLPSEASRYDRLIARGVFDLHRSEFSDASDRFRLAQDVRGTVGGIQDTWQAVLLEAQARRLQGDEVAAEQVIGTFLERHPGRAMPAVGLWVLQPVQTVLGSLSCHYPDASLMALLKLAAADPTAPRLIHAVAAIDRPSNRSGRQVEVRLFGSPRLIVDGHPSEWPYGLRHKAIELFWYGALHPDGFSRDQTLADLFPDRDQTGGLKLLQVTVSNLRSALASLLGVAGDAIINREPSGQFHFRTAGVGIEISVETRRLALLSEELRGRRGKLPSTVPELFRGELLAGLNAEWIEPIRRYWMAVYLRTLGTLADRYARHGVLQQAIRCRELALNVDPTLESAHADLMRLYHAAGDRQAVESQMWLYTRVARDELDTEPNEDVEELYRELIESSPASR